MKEQNMDEAIDLLRAITLEFTDRVNDVANLYDLDFMQCMIIQAAALTRPIIVAGREKDLNRMIHLGDKNESK